MSDEVVAPDQGTAPGHFPQVKAESLKQGGAMAVGVAAASYLVVTGITEPVMVADTPDMAVSALGRLIGQYCQYLEPGHLLWRPAGAFFLDTFGTVQPDAQTDLVLRASESQMTWFSWFAGLLAIVGCARWLQRQIGSVPAALFGVAVVLLSKAFINYAQVGASYMPALGFLMLGIVLLSDQRTGALGAIVGGASLGVSVLFWGTFALALPAALVAPFVFSTEMRRAWRNSAWACVGGGMVALIAAAWVYRGLGMNSPSDLVAWARTADHGISTGGFPRAVLGFARSYIETGDYGRLVKSYMLADAANPVPLRALIGWPLFGILGVYLSLLFMLVLASRHQLRTRVFAFVLINAIPVAVFAVLWQGGDLERYLPLVPGVALLGATAFAASSRVAQAALAGLLVLMVIPNALALGLPAVRAERERLRATTREFETPDRPLLIFSHWQDERVQFHRNYPPHEPPLLYRAYSLVTPGTASVLDWKATAARRISGAWESGRKVYVSERLLADTPRRDWDWVEGDDRRIRWSDMSQFFTAFAYREPPRGGVSGDGFVELSPVEQNRAVLEPYLPKTQARSAGCNLPATIPAAAMARVNP